MFEFMILIGLLIGAIVGITIVVSVFLCFMSYRDGHKFLWWRD